MTAVCLETEPAWKKAHWLTLGSASQVVLVVKNPPASAGDVRNLGLIPWRRAGPPASSILAWRIPWTEEPGRLWPMGSQRVRHD